LNVRLINAAMAFKPDQDTALLEVYLTWLGVTSAGFLSSALFIANPIHSRESCAHAIITNLLRECSVTENRLHVNNEDATGYNKLALAAR
jgi:hypothetical protein